MARIWLYESAISFNFFIVATVPCLRGVFSFSLSKFAWENMHWSRMRARARVQCVLWRGCWTMLRTSCGWEQKRWWCWWRCQEITRINPSGSCDLMGWFIYWRWVLCWGYRLVCEETAAVAGERICSCSCRRILIFFQARRWRGSLVSLIAEREFTRATLLATRILEGVLIRWRKKRTSPWGRGIKRKDKHNYIHDDDESCD